MRKVPVTFHAAIYSRQVQVEMLPWLEKEAKERQRLSEGRGIKGSQKIDYLKEQQGKATEQAAKLTGTNRQYVSN